MQRYYAPEGFVYDDNTGLYYKSDIVTEENGQQTLWITWFDAQSGEYSQYSYPQESTLPSESDGNNNQQTSTTIENTNNASEAMPKEPPSADLVEEGQHQAASQVDSISAQINIPEPLLTLKQEPLLDEEESSIDLTKEDQLESQVEPIIEPRLGDNVELQTEPVVKTELPQQPEPQLGSRSTLDDAQENTSTTTSAAFLPPDDFYYDPQRGLYLRTDYVTEPDGTTTKWLTWFNAQSGEYTQQSFTDIALTGKEQAITQEDNRVSSSSNTSSTNTHSVPDGFTLDQASGLYFSAIIKTSDEGGKSDFVIWYDLQTDEYAQVEYPKPPKATPAKTRSKRDTKLPQMIGCICLLLAIGGAIWHFKPFANISLPSIKQNFGASEAQSTDVAVDNQQDNPADASKSDALAGKDAENASRQDAQSNTSSANDLTNRASKLMVDIIDPQTATIKLTVDDIQSEYPSYNPDQPEDQMIYNWEVAFDKYAVSVCRFNNKNYDGQAIALNHMQNSLWLRESNGHFTVLTNLPEANVEDKTIVWNVHVPAEDFDFNKVENFEVNVLMPNADYTEVFSAESLRADSTAEIINQAAGVSRTSSQAGSNFGHASLFHVLAAEDDAYVYTLHQSDPNWKFSMEGIKGAIYRIPKGSVGSAEKIIDPNGNESSVASLAVLGDDLYFAVDLGKVKSGVSQYGYFKIPKSGGEAEHLFTDELSYMQSYGDKIYFLFRESMKIGHYDPQDKALKYEAIDTAKLVDPKLGGAKSEFSLFMPFSIYNDELYFGGLFDVQYHYYRLNLGSREVVKVESGDMSFIKSSDEGAAAIYGMNPVYEGDSILYNPDPNGFLARTTDNSLIVHDTASNVYATLKFDPINPMNPDNVLDLKMANKTSGYGATGNWILYNDTAVLIESGTVRSSVPLTKPNNATDKWKMELVQKVQNQ